MYFNAPKLKQSRLQFKLFHPCQKTASTVLLNAEEKMSPLALHMLSLRPRDELVIRNSQQKEISLVSNTGRIFNSKKESRAGNFISTY